MNLRTLLPNPAWSLACSSQVWGPEGSCRPTDPGEFKHKGSLDDQQSGGPRAAAASRVLLACISAAHRPEASEHAGPVSFSPPPPPPPKLQTFG